MENALYANVKRLYDHGLYECVITTAGLLSTLLQNDRNICTVEMEYPTMLFLSHANYEERNYRVAAQQMESVLVQRKSVQRYKSSFLYGIENSYPQFQELEMRFKLATCYRHLCDYSKAIFTLRGTKERTPRLNMLLAQLLKLHGSTLGKTETIQAFKDVLAECPMALTAINALIELGVDGNEVNSLVLNAAPVPKPIEWLSNWIKANALMYGCRHIEAAKTFQNINDTTLFRQNDYLLTYIGKCLYYYGNYVQAEQYLGMAAMVNRYNMEALMPLSVVHEFNNKKDPDHEKLFLQLRNVMPCEFTTAHWFIYAHHAYMNKKFERAHEFAERALSLDGRNIEALLLRGRMFTAQGQAKDAINIFRSAQSCAPYRFEVYKGLLACYKRLKRMKEAQAICVLTIRYFRTSPRSYTMFGDALFHSNNPAAKKNARKFAEKAVRIDDSYSPGIALMAVICQHEGAIQDAIELLRKQVTRYPHPKLYTMLAGLLSSEKDVDAALHYFSRALAMESTCQRALDGINALSKAARAVKSGSDYTSSTADVSSSTTTGPSTSSGSGATGMGATCGTPHQDWLLDGEDTTSRDALELSSPAMAKDDDDSDAFSDPFWEDVDGEMTN
ncbi:Apc7 [Drosophila busckii]|uniref:Apc7 n=2 Tax=Drosophila busckii TaxID=30019 RepID=A0A0M4EZD2_DROBS|nr:Apc7 [Drosophila busckii]